MSFSVKILVGSDELMQQSLSITVKDQQTVEELHQEVANNLSQKRSLASRYGLYRLPSEGDSHGAWLSEHSRLCDISIHSECSLSYRVKYSTVSMKVPHAGRPVQTFYHDLSASLLDLTFHACISNGFQNSEEYCLCIESGESSVWLDPHDVIGNAIKILSEGQTLALKKRYNIPEDMTQIFQHVHSKVMSENYICTEEDITKLGPLYCRIKHGNYGSKSITDNAITENGLVPESYKNKSNIILRKIVREYAKLETIEKEEEAMFKYISYCRSLRYYDVVSFEVEEKRKSNSFFKKTVRAPAILGLTRHSVMKINPKTKELEVAWPLESLQTWRAVDGKLEMRFDSAGKWKIKTKNASIIATRLKEQIEVILRERADQQQLQSCEQAMQEEGSFDQTVFQGILVGFPRSGKSTFKDRLTGLPPPKDRHFVRPSTGVAVQVRRMEVDRHTVSVGGDSWHELNDINDETFRVVSTITQDRGRIKTDRIIVCSSNDVDGSSFTNAIDTNIRPLEVLTTAVLKASDKIKSLKESWTLYLTDAGGQPEFQQLLPILVSGPSVFFFIFPLNWDLDKLYPVDYLHQDGYSMETFDSTFTVKDTILQWIASIASTRLYAQGKKITPRIIFIGTHKDKVSDADIRRKNQQLTELVEKTQAYREGMIVTTKNGLVMPIDNFSEDDHDLNEIKSVIMQLGGNDPQFKITTPYTWMIFSIVVRHSAEKVMTYESCFKLAKACGIKTDENFQEALAFLHNIGVIRYFTSTPKLRSVVIIDPQFIFNLISELIISTFDCKSLFNKFEHDRMKFKGIIPFERIQNLHTSICFTAEMFVSLLDHLHVMVALLQEGRSREFFLPCSLAHAEYALCNSEQNPQVPNLLFTFSIGYCPTGLFGAMAVRLLRDDPSSEYKWIFREKKIYRSQISISVGPYSDTMSFALFSTFIQISVKPSSVEVRKITLGSICSHIRKRIAKELDEVMGVLNYENITWELAFPCTVHDTSHVAVVHMHNDQPCTATCSHDETTTTLPRRHELWFADTDGQTSIISFESQPSLKDLHLISWEENGHGHTIKIIETVCNEWRMLGDFVEIVPGRLTSIEDQYRANTDRIREVFLLWLTKKTYPTTWRKLLSILKDCSHATLASQIEHYMNIM